MRTDYNTPIKGFTTHFPPPRHPVQRTRGTLTLTTAVAVHLTSSFLTLQKEFWTTWIN